MGALPSFAPALTAAFQTVLEASWQGSLVIGLVLLVRRALGGRVPARWRHALWWLVLARLLVPAFALPRNPASLQNVAALGHPFAEVRNLVEAAAPGYPLPDALLPPAPVVPPQGSSDEAADAPGPGSSAVASRPFHPSVWTMLAGGWLAGTSGFTVWVLVAMLRWRARLRRDPACTNPAVERLWRTCCARAGLRRPPALQATALVNSPALLGWWRPRLLVPAPPPASFTARDWENVFLHEIAHLRRRDHWTQVVQLAALGVHWFNPLVWLGARAMAADRELAADERALHSGAGHDAAGYGETLIKTLSVAPRPAVPAPGLVLGIMEERLPQLRRRLQRIVGFSPERNWGGSALGLAALAMLTAAALGQSTPPPPSGADLALYADLTPPETLYAAARRDDFPMMQRALADGADPSAVGDTRREHTALTAAAAAHHLDALRWLLARGARLNDPKDGAQSAALSAAMRNGWTDETDYLLAEGAQCDPRVLAAARGDAAAIDAWLAQGTPDAKLLQQAIEVAAPNGHAEIFARLFDAMRTQPGKRSWAPDNNVAARTVARGQRAVMEAWLQRDRNLSKDVLRLSTFAASTSGMREWLVAHGRDVPAASDNEWLIENSEHGNLPEMRELLARPGVNVNYRGESGWTALTKAAITGRSKAVKLLLAHGADPNLVRFPGTMDYTPLCFAANPATADALLAGGADLHGKTYHGRGNAMSYYLATGGTPMVKYFLDRGLLPPDEHGDSKPSLFGVTTADLAETMIQRGADVNARDQRGDSVLMHAVSQQFHPGAVVRVLLRHGADPNFYSTYWKCPPLCEANDPDTVDALIEGGADLHAKDQYGYSALCAITGASDDAARCEALMRHGLQIDVAAEGGRMMWLATARDQLGWVKLLLDHGVSANAEWYTEPGHRPQGLPLETAASFGQTEMARLLLDHGAEPSHGELAMAMTNGHKDTARMMWERGIRASSELAYAVSQGASVEQLAKIMDAGVPADPPQDTSFTPLSLAAALGDLEAVQLLVNRGANTARAFGEAVEKGNDRVVKYLLGRGQKLSWQLMVVLGNNSHPYESEQPEENFNRIAELLIHAGVLEGLTEAQAADILRATTFTRHPGGNPVILGMLFEHGLRVDSRFGSSSSPEEAADRGGATFLALAESRADQEAENYSPLPPQTLRVIEEAKRIQLSPE